MLPDITRNGISQAIDEFDRIGRDAFLDRYGFGRSRSYFVEYEGRRYDSKAICGAAHGYDHPDEGPLKPADFSGGNATVAHILGNLGYDVTRPKTTGSGWTEEERLLALDLYLRAGVIGRSHPDVIALSHELNTRAFHPDAGTRDNFRNANGVALKLANFAALDPNYVGTGMTRTSAGDRDTWHQYAGDTDLLIQAVTALRQGHDLPEAAITTTAVTPTAHPVEQRHTNTFTITPSVGPVEEERRKAALVERFAEWLRDQGHTVTAHHYDIVTPALRSDLADETTQRIWEAKADTGRTSVRTAIGQLIDYLRFEPGQWSGGILLPHRPSDDLLTLISEAAGRAAAWPVSPTEFQRVEPSH